MNILLALVDYIPVVFFAIGSVYLQRGLYERMSKGSFAVFSTGTIMIITAGVFKASWKLLYYSGVCDFVALNNCFFPLQTAGFFFAAAGLTGSILYSKKKNIVFSVAAPAVFDGTMLFVVIMILGVTGLYSGLAIIAKKEKKNGAIALFILSLIFTLGMGYMATKDFANPMMNWVAEAINILGQGTYCLGAILLTKKNK